MALLVAEAVCECGRIVERESRHRAACTRSSRPKTRALAPERTLARVCRKAGATVRFNTKLLDMNLLAVAANDDRAIEVLVSGLALFFEARLAVDISLRCAEGRAQPAAAAVDGAACTRVGSAVRGEFGRCSGTRRTTHFASFACKGVETTDAHSRGVWWFIPKCFMFSQGLTDQLQIWQICSRRNSDSFG